MLRKIFVTAAMAVLFAVGGCAGLQPSPTKTTVFVEVELGSAFSSVLQRRGIETEQFRKEVQQAAHRGFETVSVKLVPVEDRGHAANHVKVSVLNLTPATALQSLVDVKFFAQGEGPRGIENSPVAQVPYDERGSPSEAAIRFARTLGYVIATELDKRTTWL